MIAPGFGTAAGAIIGAAVGGLMGRANKIKDEKSKARKAFESAFDGIVTQNMVGIQQRMLDSGGVGKSEIVKDKEELSAAFKSALVNGSPAALKAKR